MCGCSSPLLLRIVAPRSHFRSVGATVIDPTLTSMPPNVDDFSCAICLETLHKPAVNHCGHGEARYQNLGSRLLSLLGPLVDLT